MLRLHRRLVLVSVAAAACIAAACGNHQAPNALPGLPGADFDSANLPLSAPPKPKLYAANATGQSVTEYSLTAKGNAPPLRTIIGSDTDLHSPNGIAVDSHGFIYVANIGNTPADIDVYRPSANGDARPVRTIAPKSPHPTLFSSKGLAFDASDNLYVADVSGGILVFAAVQVAMSPRFARSQEATFVAPTPSASASTHPITCGQRTPIRYASTLPGPTAMQRRSELFRVRRRSCSKHRTSKSTPAVRFSSAMRGLT
jgi:sugar lactone lactonase YvrE